MHERRGMPHHLIDIVDPTGEYTAAQYARDAAAVIRDIGSRGKLPLVVGGTGFYYRALTRGLFPGPGRDAALRARLEAVAGAAGRAVSPSDAETRGSGVGAADPAARSEAHCEGARGVLSDRPAADGALRRHDVAAPGCGVVRRGLRLPATRSRERVSARVDQQFSRGLLDEVRGLLARGVPEHGPAVRRARVPAGSRTSARRARRDRDARADRAGEPPLRAASVDLVPQRA